MNTYKNICFFISMFLFSSVTYAQKVSKTYFHPSAAFHIDSIFTPISRDMINSNATSHVWLNTLNSQYVDTAKNHIQSTVVPAYVPLKKGSLLNPYSATNQIIGVMLPYGYYLPYTQYGLTMYDPANRAYHTVPYGYSPYNIKAITSPNYILPKF